MQEQQTSKQVKKALKGLKLQTAKKINLHRKRLTPLECKEIAGLLKENLQIKRIDLSGNGVGDLQVEMIHESLVPGEEDLKRFGKESILFKLSSLNLADNEVTVKGADLVGDIIRFTNLLSLNVSQNSLLSPGCCAIADSLTWNPDLRHLNLSRNQICPLGAERLGQVLKSNTKLLTLNLGYNHIQDQGLKHLCEGLAKNPTLQSLIIPSCGITDIGAQHLAMLIRDNKTLTNLDISNNPLTDTGLKLLRSAIDHNEILVNIGIYGSLATSTTDINYLIDSCIANRDNMDMARECLILSRKIMGFDLPHEILASVLTLYTSHLPPKCQHAVHAVLLDRALVGMVFARDQFSPGNLSAVCGLLRRGGSRFNWQK
jgi:Leucine Rich repeat